MKTIVFTAEVDEKSAKKFDEIAGNNFRSRTAHLLFIIQKEIEFHEEREKED